MAVTTLIIVESAAKARTLSKFLGKNYRLKASVGHIKDLPKSKLGIDVNNSFGPQYITIRGKGPLLQEIKKEAQKADKILLATDPDREGEAIAWHLQNAMNLEPGSKCRIEFNEITKDAVKAAFKNARAINTDRVDAQQARRVLDRLVGYNLSPLLWAKVHKGLSAGRVQSVVVRIICEREKEIQAFTPQEYWTIDADLLNNHKQMLTARLVACQGRKLEIVSGAQKDKIIEALKSAIYKVTKVEEKQRVKKPFPPFTTSTMQQEASKRLNFFTKRTMRVAQELYEGLSLGKVGTVGLITYLRTDSTRLADEAQSEALDFINQQYGSRFAPAKLNIYKTKKTAQDAHEAIRPTSVYRTPDSIKEFLSRDQYRLYKLIWERFVASQMTAAKLAVKTAEINTDNDYTFRVNSTAVMFPGYQKVYNAGKEEEASGIPLPALTADEKLTLKQIKPEQHFTQPPARYTEASLVKLLEEKNIGRPSTYAPIIDTIIKRRYVERKERQFVPTDLGFIVVDLLKKYFADIVDIEFTANMEENLDKIEEGELEWTAVVSDFYTPFSKDLDKAEAVIEKVELKDEEAGRDCPVCGKPLLIKHGRFGQFIACSGFPECRYTESISKEIGVACPKCGQPLVALRTKTNRGYYGCKGYPECDYRSWNKPTNQKCPVCGDVMLEKPTKSAPNQVICQNPECKHLEDGKA